MGRKIESLSCDGDVEVTTEALAYETAEDLLPEVMAILGGGNNLSNFAAQLGGGKLKRLAPQILATTSVVMSIAGEKLKFDLVKKEDRATVFEARPDIYFKVLTHAAKVTFGPFFPGVVLGQKDSPKDT